MTRFFARRRDLRPPGAIALIGAFLLLALATWGSTPSGCGVVFAHDTLPADFCYRSTIDVTNNGASPIVDYPVRLTFNPADLIAVNQLGPYAGDLVPTTSSLSEIELLMQDLDSATAPWWIHVPQVDAAGTVPFDFYFGSDESKRDQGVTFTGSETLTATSHADFDITDRLVVETRAEFADVTARDETILSRWTADTGYRLQLANVVGTLNLRAQVDGVQLDVPWSSSWTDTNRRIRMEFIAPTLRILVDGVEQGTTNTGLGSITNALGVDLTIGTSLSGGTLREVQVFDNVGVADSVVARWGFHAQASAGVDGCTELTAADPVYTGTCADGGAGGHTLAYSFNRPQSNISVVVGPVQLTSAPTIVSLVDDIPDIFGVGLATEFIGAGPENIRSPFFRSLDTWADAINFPRPMFWAGLTMMAGTILLLIVTLGTRQPVYGLMAGALPIYWGSSRDLYNGWVFALWVGLGLVVMGTSLMRKETGS